MRLIDLEPENILPAPGYPSFSTSIRRVATAFNSIRVTASKFAGSFCDDPFFTVAAKNVEGR